MPGTAGGPSLLGQQLCLTWNSPHVPPVPLDYSHWAPQGQTVGARFCRLSGCFRGGANSASPSLGPPTPTPHLGPGCFKNIFALLDGTTAHPAVVSPGRQPPSPCSPLGLAHPPCAVTKRSPSPACTFQNQQWRLRRETDVRVSHT